jgi:hypothetical protein
VKIAIVGPAHPYKGGAAQHTTALAHRLSAAGHDTTLVSWRAQYPKLIYHGQLTIAEPERSSTRAWSGRWPGTGRTAGG